MTNMIDSIDPAILRRGRFDHIIEVKMASAEEIAALLKARFSELPVDETVDADIIAKSLDGHPMSDVRNCALFTILWAIIFTSFKLTRNVF